MLLPVPKDPIPSLNDFEKVVLKRLKNIYLSDDTIDDSISLVYQEPKLDGLLPDFILLDPMRGVCVIEVKSWNLKNIDRVTDKEVFTKDGKKMENPASKAVRYFNRLQALLSKEKELLDDSGKLKIVIQSVVILNRITKEDAKKHNFEDRFKQYPARVIYYDEFKTMRVDSLWSGHGKTVGDTANDIIRASLFPEVKIDVSSYKDEFNSIPTLDYKQERVAKDPSLGKNGYYMITGIPGSGKTIILIARAIFLAKTFKDWNILVVSFTKGLVKQLEHKIDRKIEDTPSSIPLANIEVRSFHSVAKEFSSLNPKNYEDKEEFWREILPQDAMKNAKPIYDAILVDEYQDFYKDWLKLLLKLIKEHKNANRHLVKHIFFAGDRLQSIYNPREINWKQDLNLDMRGHSQLLKTSYRVTKEHIDLGLEILQKEPKYKSEVQKFYQSQNASDITSTNRIKNSIELISGALIRAVARYKELLDEYQPEDILLIAPSWSIINNVKSKLSEKFYKNITKPKEFKEGCSIFSTYHSAKGIEARVVLMLNIEEIEERKLFYVGVTRASQKVILHSTNFKKSNIAKEVLEFFNRREDKSTKNN